MSNAWNSTRFGFKCSMSKAEFANESASNVNREANEFKKWLPDFKNPKHYVDQKLKMLRGDMRIQVTDKEVKHLRSLKTEASIDNAVRTIINNHWN